MIKHLYKKKNILKRNLFLPVTGVLASITGQECRTSPKVIQNRTGGVATRPPLTAQSRSNFSACILTVSH